MVMLALFMTVSCEGETPDVPPNPEDEDKPAQPDGEDSGTTSKPEDPSGMLIIDLVSGEWTVMGLTSASSSTSKQYPKVYHH